MGTKRSFDEDLQEFMKHPKLLEYVNKSDSFVEDKHPLETSQNVGISGEDGDNLFHSTTSPKCIYFQDFEPTPPGPVGPVFCSNLFPEFFEFNTPRRPLVHHDDTYSPLFNCTPRKEVPVGPAHQADIPKHNSKSIHEEDEIKKGILVLSPLESGCSNETLNTRKDCECSDGGSIRCVQEHVHEARIALKESLGDEKFVELGFNNMGEEVSSNWTEEEENLFHKVVYSNPVSHGKKFWEQLAIAFPVRSTKELVCYYFNVFMLRRRAIQNRSNLLEIDSDDDEWWGSKKGVGPSVDHGGHECSSSENGGGEGCGTNQDRFCNSQIDDKIIISEIDQENEKGLKQEGNINNNNNNNNNSNNNNNNNNNCGLRSESYLHWEPPYSTMGSTKGVDLLPTCSMIEEIFGSSKTGKNG